MSRPSEYEIAATALIASATANAGDNPLQSTVIADAEEYVRWLRLAVERADIPYPEIRLMPLEQPRRRMSWAERRWHILDRLNRQAEESGK